MHVKPLVPVAFAVVSTHSGFRVDVRQAAGRKKIAASLSQHDEKHVVPTPLSAIRVRRCIIIYFTVVILNLRY
jgi:hypothetical protein